MILRCLQRSQRLPQLPTMSDHANVTSAFVDHPDLQSGGRRERLRPRPRFDGAVHFPRPDRAARSLGGRHGQWPRPPAPAVLQTLHHGWHGGPDREGLLLPGQRSEPASAADARSLLAPPHLPGDGRWRGVALAGLGGAGHVSGLPELPHGSAVGAQNECASGSVRFAHSQGRGTVSEMHTACRGLNRELTLRFRTSRSSSRDSSTSSYSAYSAVRAVSDLMMNQHLKWCFFFCFLFRS